METSNALLTIILIIVLLFVAYMVGQGRFARTLYGDMPRSTVLYYRDPIGDFYNLRTRTVVYQVKPASENK